jgi:hypothetical protein
LIIELVAAVLGVLVNVTNMNASGCEIFTDSEGLRHTTTLLHTLLCTSRHADNHEPCRTRTVVHHVATNSSQEQGGIEEKSEDLMSQSEIEKTDSLAITQRRTSSNSQTQSQSQSQSQQAAEMFESIQQRVGGATTLSHEAAIVWVEHFDLITMLLSLLANCVEQNPTNRLQLFYMSEYN